MDKISIGYQAICEKLSLRTLPHYRESYVTRQGRGKIILDNHHETHIYPKTYALKNENDLLEHLEFALKHEDVNLAIIKALFENLEKSEITQYIQKQPNGIYSRRIWYFYEFLMEEVLNLPDCQGLKYIDLIDAEKYFTCKARKSSRHAVNDNLLGNKHFCPFVLRTEKINTYIKSDLDLKATKILKKYDPFLITRACHYLYTKETMSSYQIEREQPDKTRVIRFIEVLQKLSTLDEISKEKLIELQNIIVDPRFKDTDYRHNQNYVGENVSPYLQKIHYISPKPEDVPDLMSGLLDSLSRMLMSQVHPVVIAAVISFGFVFIHPFEDGNGRIHRLLIHYILSKQHFTPREIIFPVSSVMLKNMNAYDAVLESFSKPLLSRLTNYNLSDDGAMCVNQESRIFYQYIDFTQLVEYLFTCIEDAIFNHLEPEIKFILLYDKTKKLMQSVVDMPDKQIDLFIKLTMQNQGRISASKQKRYFPLLQRKEINELARIVKNTMLKDEEI